MLPAGARTVACPVTSSPARHDSLSKDKSNGNLSAIATEGAMPLRATALASFAKRIQTLHGSRRQRWRHAIVHNLS